MKSTTLSFISVAMVFLCMCVSACITSHCGIEPEMSGFIPTYLALTCGLFALYAIPTYLISINHKRMLTIVSETEVMNLTIDQRIFVLKQARKLIKKGLVEGICVAIAKILAKSSYSYPEIQSYFLMNRTVAINNFGATYGGSYWWYSSHSKESKLSRLNYMDYLLDQHKKLKIEDSYKQKLQTSLNKNKS